jgi:histidyl-tRNA synthetase
MKIQSLKGTNDILPDEIKKWQLLESTCRNLFELYGYEEIRTPIIEKADLFKRSVGQSTDIVQKEMFIFEDKAKRKICLRPEETASVARAYIQHALINKTGLAKLYYLGAMFRSERPQAGRYRQFNQFGIEAIGTYSPYLDAEIITLMNQLVSSLGLKNYEIVINTLGCAKDRQDYKNKLLKSNILDKKKKEKLCDDCQRRLKNNPLRVLDCKKPQCKTIIKELPTPIDSLCQDCLKHYNKVKKFLDRFKIKYREDSYLVRGLDYYNRTTFELIHNSLGSQNALIAGGRYDKLIPSFGGPEVGACGFAGGMERLIMAAEADKANLATKNIISVYVATLDEASFEYGFDIINQIRSKGIRAHISYESKSLKAQMRQANKLGCSFAIIIGEEEIKAKKYTLKDMQQHTQQTINKDKLLNTLLKANVK